MKYIIVQDRLTEVCTYSIKPSLLTGFYGKDTYYDCIYECDNKGLIKLHCDSCNESSVYVGILNLLTRARIAKNTELLFELHQLVVDWHYDQSRISGRNKYLKFQLQEVEDLGIF